MFIRFPIFLMVPDQSPLPQASKSACPRPQFLWSNHAPRSAYVCRARSLSPIMHLRLIPHILSTHNSYDVIHCPTPPHIGIATLAWLSSLGLI